MESTPWIKWFIVEDKIILDSGDNVFCYRISWSMDSDALDSLAHHFRQLYIEDEEIDEGAKATKTPRDEYIKKFVIPQRDEDLGPAVRSGDFGEIVMADLFEFVLHFSVPRLKMKNRPGKNNSMQGTDVLAYKFQKDPSHPCNQDRLAVIESKAGLSSDDYSPVSKAIQDSQNHDRNELRYIYSLEYFRKALKSKKCETEAQEIERFEGKADNDYKLVFVPAAVINRESLSKEAISSCITGGNLYLKKNDRLFIVHGSDLLRLENEIYDRCTK